MLIQWFHRSFQEHMSTTLQVSRQCQGSVYSCQSSNGSGGSCSLSEEWDTFWALRMRNCDQLMKPQFIWVPKTLQNASTKNTSIWPSTCNISNISFWDPNKTRFTHRWATWSNDIWLGISNASAHRAHPLCKENVSSWSVQFLLCGSLYDPPWPSPVLHDAVSNIRPIGMREQHGWA
jgi:hypothetical protein